MIKKNILKMHNSENHKHSEHNHVHGIGDKEIYGAYKIFFGTLVSESRLKIINFLRNGGKNVSEIMYELKMNQTAVSHDLARLKQCGFVKVEINGKYRNYSLNEKTIKPVMKLIDEHMSEYCIHILRSKGGEEK